MATGQRPHDPARARAHRGARPVRQARPRSPRSPRTCGCPRSSPRCCCPTWWTAGRSPRGRPGRRGDIRHRPVFAGGSARWPTTTALTADLVPRPRLEDPGRRRLRGRQDHLRRRGQRDRAAEHRGDSSPQASVGTDNLDGRRGQDHHHRRHGLRPDHPRPSSTSSTCSARPGRTGSGSCGTSWPTGALGAVVLADTRRLEDCFAAVDFFERRGIAFIVAVNGFDGAYRYEPEEVRARWTSSPRCRSCSATPGSPAPGRGRWSPSSSTCSARHPACRRTSHPSSVMLTQLGRSRTESGPALMPPRPPLDRCSLTRDPAGPQRAAGSASSGLGDTPRAEFDEFARRAGRGDRTRRTRWSTSSTKAPVLRRAATRPDAAARDHRAGGRRPRPVSREMARDHGYCPHVVVRPQGPGAGGRLRLPAVRGQPGRRRDRHPLLPGRAADRPRRDRARHDLRRRHRAPPLGAGGWRPSSTWRRRCPTRSRPCLRPLRPGRAPPPVGWGRGEAGRRASGSRKPRTRRRVRGFSRSGPADGWDPGCERVRAAVCRAGRVARRQPTEAPTRSRMRPSPAAGRGGRRRPRPSPAAGGAAACFGAVLGDGR